MEYSVSHDEPSTSDVKVLSSTVRIKKEFESEDETEKQKLHSLVNTPVRYEEVTLHWPPHLYKNTVDHELKTIPQQSRNLLQTIQEATVSSATETFVAMAIAAEEISAEKNRVFRITTWPSYYKQYLSEAPLKKTVHFSEGIPDEQPVHCYMDIDVDLVGSSVAQFQTFIEKLDAKVKSFCKYLEEFIIERFNVDTIYTVVLFSHDIPYASLLAGAGTKAGKYSSHIVMHMNGGEIMFKNSFHLNNFLSDFLFAMQQVRPDLIDIHLQEFGCSLVKEKDDIISLLDMNVYRRNGELRMPYSSKFTDPKRKMIPTLLTGIDQRKLLELYDLEEEPKRLLSPEEGMFYASLVTFIPKKVTVSNLLAHQRANVPRKRLNALTPADFALDPENKPVTFGLNTKHSENGFYQDMNQKFRSGSGITISTSENKNGLEYWDDYQFFELLAKDIESNLPEEYFMGLTLLQVLPPGIVVFANKGTYCEIKQDNHRSNHTYYVCYLEDKRFYQRCFDEECKFKMDVHYERVYGPPDGTKKYQPKTAKACYHYFSLFVWEPITQFLKRHKEKLSVPLAKERDEETGESDPKQPKLDFSQTIKKAYVPPRTSTEMTVEALLSILMEDMKDLKGQ